MRDYGFPLGDEYEIELFADSEVKADDVIAMWLREGVMPEQEARRRVDELQLVATFRGREVVGVTTTYLDYNSQLRTNMWHFRAFVTASHRRSALGVVMTCYARDVLREAFERGDDRRAAGILMEVENEVLKREFPQALWYYVWFNFIGVNSRGDHVRVHWFPGAELPEP